MLTGNRRINLTISKVLIANRGEIACRILCACKKLLITVAIYAQNDTGTIFTELADEAGFLLEGDSIASTYLDQSQILEIARISGADAIHPGFGFYQNGQISHRQVDAGIQWVGPSPEAISKMGDKMTARITMRMREYP